MMHLFFFFFNDTATTEIYTLSLHDALPISRSWLGLLAATPRPSASHSTQRVSSAPPSIGGIRNQPNSKSDSSRDRKSTRLNSSHANISYAVFCLKKKKTKKYYKIRYNYIIR